jgi:hypothetical protein
MADTPPLLLAMSLHSQCWLCLQEQAGSTAVVYQASYQLTTHSHGGLSSKVQQHMAHMFTTPQHDIELTKVGSPGAQPCCCCCCCCGCCCPRFCGSGSVGYLLPCGPAKACCCAHPAYAVRHAGQLVGPGPLSTTILLYAACFSAVDLSKPFKAPWQEGHRVLLLPRLLNSRCVRHVAGWATKALLQELQMHDLHSSHTYWPRAGSWITTCS